MDIKFKKSFSINTYNYSVYTLYDEIKNNITKTAYEILQPPFKGYLDLECEINEDKTFYYLKYIINLFKKHNIIIFNATRFLHNQNKYRISFHVLFPDLIFADGIVMKNYFIKFFKKNTINFDKSVYCKKGKQRLFRLPYTMKYNEDDILKEVDIQKSMINNRLETKDLDLSKILDYIISLPYISEIYNININKNIDFYNDLLFDNNGIIIDIKNINITVENIKKKKHYIKISEKEIYAKQKLKINSLSDLAYTFNKYIFPKIEDVKEFISEYINNIISYIIESNTYVVKCDDKYILIEKLPEYNINYIHTDSYFKCISISLSTILKHNNSLKTYNSYSLMPHEKSNDIFNMWTGIIAKQINFISFKIKYIIEYIKKIWAKNNDDDFYFIINWIKNIINCKKTKKCIILYSNNTNINNINNDIINWIINDIIGTNHSKIINTRESIYNNRELMNMILVYIYDFNSLNISDYKIINNRVININLRINNHKNIIMYPDYANYIFISNNNNINYFKDNSNFKILDIDNITDIPELILDKSTANEFYTYIMYFFNKCL
ncbi:hypothetical protein MYSEV_043 [Mythimna separata entomopoxvirus 'L']|uniref:Uncharacterized protein n=1 Tax=Mythimna separata entomopoxvirus 'L' TaxID=1293572 RepID=A0A916KQC6_9POXV|nr:hypothetical protein MYSEV_043 [Mythimna separata entomopoxvirus 'L']CCU56241.1 hypothetical protein MYSEV_043 [Mythimna separata entomopoxvirus 'L']